MYAIELEDLTKNYGKARGIKNVNLTVNPGEVFGFIGPNGAGKSTTIRTMMDLIHPSSGRATILGLDSHKDTKAIKQRVGYIPSEVSYYPDMKVLDLLKYSKRFYKHASENRLHALADRLDLSLVAKIGDLSLGNKKKVAIVQALLHEPKLLILDEPTSGLDPLMQARFFEILREEQARGVTTFFSSHVLTEVQNLCHRVAIVKDGQIVQIEEIESLRRRSLRKVRLEWTHGQEDKTPDLSRHEGVTSWHTDGSGAHFYFSGPTSALIQVLFNKPIEQLWIEEPSLEEIFMHYYAKES